MRRFTLRTAGQLDVPAAAEKARELRRLDDGLHPPDISGLDLYEARDALTKHQAAVDAVKADRARAANASVSPWWRTRPAKLPDGSPNDWPPWCDIEAWRGLGASHALLYTPSRLVTTHRPHERAYDSAYRAVFGAYMDTPEIKIDAPSGGIDPRLAAAWVKTAAEVGTLSRDQSGPKGAYSSADNVSGTAKDAMAKNGLTWARTGVTFESCALATCELGNQYYVGDSVETWMLVHESGAVLTGTTRAAVIASKGRPHDKAGAATLTYNSGQTLRGLFNMEREGKNSTERRQDDDARGSGRQNTSQRDDLCDPNTATAIGTLCGQIAQHVGRDDVDRMTVLRGALAKTGHQYNADIQGGRDLTRAEALLVHPWLIADLKTYPTDDDQSAAGAP